ncbi:MAG: hypothetical protein ACRC5A_15080 [Enterobacteriaceae bacterium]
MLRTTVVIAMLLPVCLFSSVSRADRIVYHFAPHSTQPFSFEGLEGLEVGECHLAAPQDLTVKVQYPGNGVSLDLGDGQHILLSKRGDSFRINNKDLTDMCFSSGSTTWLTNNSDKAVDWVCLDQGETGACD